MSRAVIALSVSALLAGCGGRAAAPVPESRSTDAAMTCAHLAAEWRTNIARLAELEQESGDMTRDSIGMALFVAPIWIDARQGASKDIDAVILRNERVAALAREKDCDATTLEASAN